MACYRDILQSDMDFDNSQERTNWNYGRNENCNTDGYGIANKEAE
jgi:hypothetical protein